MLLNSLALLWLIQLLLLSLMAQLSPALFAALFLGLRFETFGAILRGRLGGIA